LHLTPLLQNNEPLLTFAMVLRHHVAVNSVNLQHMLSVCPSVCCVCPRSQLIVTVCNRGPRVRCLDYISIASLQRKLRLI